MPSSQSKNDLDDDSEHSMSMNFLVEERPTAAPVASPVRSTTAVPRRARERTKGGEKEKYPSKSMSPVPRHILSGRTTPKSSKGVLRLPSKGERRGKMRVSDFNKSESSLNRIKALNEDFQNLDNKSDDVEAVGKVETAPKRPGLGGRTYSTSRLKLVEVVNEDEIRRNESKQLPVPSKLRRQKTVDETSDPTKSKTRVRRTISSSAASRSRSKSPTKNKVKQSTEETAKKEKETVPLSPLAKMKAYKSLGTKLTEKFSKNLTNFANMKPTVVAKDLEELAVQVVPSKEKSQEEGKAQMASNEDSINQGSWNVRRSFTSLDSLEDLQIESKNQRSATIPTNNRSRVQRAGTSPSALKRMSSSFSKHDEMKTDFSEKRSKSKDERAIKKETKKKGKRSDTKQTSNASERKNDKGSKDVQRSKSPNREPLVEPERSPGKEGKTPLQKSRRSPDDVVKASGALRTKEEKALRKKEEKDKSKGALMNDGSSSPGLALKVTNLAKKPENPKREKSAKGERGSGKKLQADKSRPRKGRRSSETDAKTDVASSIARSKSQAPVVEGAPGIKVAAELYALAFSQPSSTINFDHVFKEKSENLMKVLLAAQNLPHDASMPETGEVNDLQTASINLQQKMKKASPPSFLCPISDTIMKDPVTTSAGSTYERKAIQWWLSTSDMDPLTQQTMTDTVLVPNNQLKETIEEWKENFQTSVVTASEGENLVLADSMDGMMEEPQSDAVMPSFEATSPGAMEAKYAMAEQISDIEAEDPAAGPTEGSGTLSQEIGDDEKILNSTRQEPIEEAKSAAEENAEVSYEDVAVEDSQSHDLLYATPSLPSLAVVYDPEEKEAPADLEEPMEDAIEAMLANLRRASQMDFETVNEAVTAATSLLQPAEPSNEPLEGTSEHTSMLIDEAEAVHGTQPRESLPGYDWTAAAAADPVHKPMLGVPSRDWKASDGHPEESVPTGDVRPYDWKAASPKRSQPKPKASLDGLAEGGFWTGLAAASHIAPSQPAKDSTKSPKTKAKGKVTIQHTVKSPKNKKNDTIKELSQSTSALMDIVRWRNEASDSDSDSSSSDDSSAAPPKTQGQTQQPIRPRKSFLFSDSDDSDSDLGSDSEESTERKEASISIISLDAKKIAEKSAAFFAENSLAGSRESLRLDDICATSRSVISSTDDEESMQVGEVHQSLSAIDASGDGMRELPNVTKRRRQMRRPTHASLSALDFVQFTPKNFVQQREERFKDFYELGQLLGEGEFGEVFVGYPKQGGHLGEQRAIKIIDKGRMCKGDYEQVINEFNLLKGLSHPNLLTLYGFYEDDSNCYIVTDLCKGGELWDELNARGHFEEVDAAAFMTNLLSAVKFLQSHNIVHRDINLENILLEENKELDQMKIIDFGLATKYEDGVKLTDLVGKVYYVAPEVLNMSYEGSKYDVWSCGVIAFILLSGYAPFEGETDGLVMEQVVLGLRDANFNDPAWDVVSDEAKDFVRHLLTYEEDERPTAEQALKHSWIQRSIKAHTETFMQSYGGSSISCFENMQDFASDASFKLKQAVHVFIASQLLLKEEREEIDRVFRGMDDDCDGKLSKLDIKKGYLRFFNKELSNEETDKMFMRINTSSTGFIDYTEFVIAAMQKSKILDSEKLRAAFCSFDRGNKGFISAGDLKIALAGVIAVPAENEKGMDADGIIQEMISQVDIEGDGKISYQNFEDMMMTSGVAEHEGQMELCEDDRALPLPSFRRVNSLNYDFA